MPLVHFTDNIDLLASILSVGIIYSHNETEVLEPVYQEVTGRSFEGHYHGMACFTEINREEILLGSDIFGEDTYFGGYGVGLSNEFIASIGGKPVTYIDMCSHEYEKLKTLAHSLIQTSFRMKNSETDEEIAMDDGWLQNLATQPGWRERFNDNPNSVRFFEAMDFAQTSLHIAEREWRVRSEKTSKDLPAQMGDYVQLKLGMAGLIKPGTKLFFQSIGIHLTTDIVEFVVCPSGEEKSVAQLLDKLGYVETEIISFPISL
ncbi:MAG: hypothetical protein HOE64_07695 [Nitrospina sp.]|jgi:hypothetical protein|nr:hypothetical protein [Nitrospina sp.]